MWKSIKRLLIYLNLMAEKATETDAINEAQVEAGIRAQKRKPARPTTRTGNWPVKLHCSKTRSAARSRRKRN